MKHITNLIRHTLTFFIFFFLSFMWIQYYQRQYIQSLLLAIFISITLTIFISLLQNKKSKKYRQLKIKENEVEQFGKNLLLCSDEEIIKICEPLAQGSDHYEYAFHTFCVTPNDILSILHQHHTQQKITIFCYQYDKTILDFVKHITNKTIILYHYQDIYTLLCNLQKLPTLPTYYQPEKHTTIKQILSTACKKEKAKSYFLSGLFFGIGSLFIRYNIYYMVMSTLLFLLALYALCNKKYNDTKP